MNGGVAKPIIKQIKDNKESLDFWKKELLPKDDEKYEIL